MEDGLLGLLGVAWTLTFGVVALAHVRAAFAKEDEGLKLVVLAAAYEAGSRRHPRVTLLHFVLALTCDPEVGRRLAAIASLDDLRDALSSGVDAADTPAREGESASADVDVDGASIGRAADGLIQTVALLARRRARRTPTPAQYFGALLDALARDGAIHPELVTILERFGVTRAAWAASRSPREGVRGPPASPYRGTPDPLADRAVRIWNDDATTQALVVDVLTGTFGRSPIEARYLMLRTHTLGSATFGGYTADDAERLVASATKHARDADAPLRMTIEPVAGVTKKRGVLASFLR